MKEWYQSLGTLELVYFYIAAVATVFLIVQIIIMICSFAGVSDVDGDGIADSDEIGGNIGDNGLSLFTVKGITAFFAVGGWTGLALFEGVPSYKGLGIALSVVAGAAAMMVVALVMRAILKLQCSGNVDMEKLEGKEASVYVSIRHERTGRGKVTLTAQGRYMEIDAVTDEKEDILYGETVVIERMESGTAVVKKNKKESGEVPV